MFDFLRSTPPVHDPLEPPAPGAANEVKHTTCYMCACRCGIRVHLRDGEVRYIDGNPDHPLNQGKICAKGSSGIMKQHSPARLTVPLKRRPGTARGDGEYVEISWDEVYAILTERLGRIRATDPKRFALFTGRDQMQALTALWARQFGTPNYAAHGGFCSVNMAAGMIYSIGGSFWEFGGPDLEHARLFVMIGTAEDHHSNPLKTAISKFKRAGGRFISINPVRTGYSAIAHEWIPIRPGTDGALFMALIRELIATGEFDRDFVARHTNAMDLVDLDSGLIVGTGDALEGEREVAGKPARPAFELLRERVADCTPEWASAITGIPAARIVALAREMGETAMRGAFELPIPWTDTDGVEHAGVVARPVAFHAMRGLAAHSNGFQTIRALAILMSLLGTIDRPGGFRHKAPFPKAIPPGVRPPNSWDQVRPMTPLGAAPLGFPAGPDDLAVGPDGEPIRIDKGFSWEHPLSAHGLMHNVITNAWRGDPYRIDTLLIFMANMAWNSTMNTTQVRAMLNDRDPGGEYRIPFIAVCDAFASEMTQYADLILPDTTYLERHDAMSLLDRPISEFDGPVDSVRIPVVAPKGQCKPFQEVLIELGWRLKLPVFTDPDGGRKYQGYEDFIVRYETAPGSGIGFLGGWRGANGDKSLVGEPNPRQWEKYAENHCVFHHELPPGMQYMRNWNRDYLAFARQAGFNGAPEPIRIHLYSPVMQEFRLAAQGRRAGKQPPPHLRARIERHFDPLPFWSPPLEYAATDLEKYPLNAITQRPMAMYHSWDSQNAWLRQIHSHNYLMVNPATARAAGIEDGGWIWVESQWGRLRCMCRYSEAVEPGTVWTWNAIGKSRGAWNLGPQADESSKGFLLNHLISEELPLPGGGPVGTVSNSDPVTGQAGWYDVRVRISPADPGEPKEVWPRFPAMKQMPGTGIIRKVQAYFAGNK
ncbi:molybdopterin oxidoreductase family protein [Pigmentiphaga sp. YJ18]|uniref:molybdopterin oxidoreductase family protein n=1 Tax=Pigmentiphaga sp. YJ18 TaxID=3134907 RepID=UPI00310F798B